MDNATDWHDAADLFEQGAVMASMASKETHTPAASRYVEKRLNALALWATKKALEKEQSAT